ncbi:amino acid adenylation domain-containing protein (plasmid) [Streptomyces sp. NBC_00335]|uniref:non-ribosomal peptide synthetase n=1 Tax=unclassified Streptomyces TaxID=2593676 RepID=UPI00224E5D18|nr:MULTISPECIES: non-ribosomal peptide synthetase [unclassified Streptomyces]MCX5410112.1 amino acid adenylation domain-containing protein [Streptomyces sp. NBC_00086]
MFEPRTGYSPDEIPLTHHLVARQASRTPGAVAVVDGRRSIGYAELDRSANQLARHLRALGAGPEVPVAVCLPRGHELVTALLAVWKAGAAYVPLDPEQPPARLAWLVKDTGAAVAITSADAADAVLAAGARPVVPAELGETLAVLPDHAPETGPDPANAAYVLYTSGSTGRPKGVVVPHAGIANRIDWAVRSLALTPADRVLQKTAPTFDAHCWEIFAPLTCGASVVIAPAGAERDPAAMVRAVGDSAATVLQVVPSVLRMLVEESGWERCASLRAVTCAGEPLHAELAQRLRQLSAAELWNTYGPTECSVDVAAHRFDPEQTSGLVPIGRPIDGIRLLVTDPAGAPVGVGTPGELHIGGTGVARGYAGRPGLTGDRFVPDPYAKDGSRLYRTGDRVRWRADGVLEFLGRLDDQVKINGVRIEPGEIEAQLAAHPAVAGAVVTAYALPDGAKRLAAYVRLRDGETLPDLRGFLQERLPATHVPGVFVELDSFPLTTSGKVDRRALPAPGTTADTRSTRHRSPATAAERLVAGVWQDILKIDSVGLDDDFFRLGGTSLQLTRLASRLRAVSGREIQLRGLFVQTTLAGQAALLGPADEPGPRPVPRGTPLPLSYGQRGMWFLDRIAPQGPDWVSWVQLDVPAEAGPDTVQQVVDALTARHEALRTRYVETDGEPLQIIDPAVRIEVRTATAAPGETGALLAADRAHGFDLEHGPLLRALLVRAEDGSQVLGLAMHHITTDGWSSGILEREFALLTEAALRGTHPLGSVLPALPVQYADYAAWQRGRLTEAVLAPVLAHWRAQLDGAPELALPTDRPRPAVRDGKGAAALFDVPADVVAGLTALGKRHGATPFMTLLTAYAAVLARHSGQWDLSVGTPVAGRGLPELEGVVGFFLGSLVLRCRLDGSRTFAEALDAVAGTAKDAFAQPELPFERLVEELVPDRDLGRTPLYQVAFDLHGGEFNGRVEDERARADLRDAWRIAHTDLTLMMRPGPDGSFFGAFEYATSLFDAATAERLAGHFTRVLAAVAADPELRLDALELAGPQERAETTARSSAPALPAGPAVPELVAAQAVRTPGATAVRGDGFTLTYAELDARANRIAHHLRSLGVRPDSAVGVLLDRGPDLHAALLGVWRAGAAYVPLDPAFPAGRVEAMLDAAGARTVLTRDGYAERFAAGARTVVDLADPDGRIAAAPAGAPAVPADQDRLAYVIFTSGSTGTPKGVGVPHRGLAHHLAWATATLAGAGDGGSAVFSSVAFDLVVPNLWAPLTCGQSVHLLPANLDLSELGKRLADGGPYSFLKLTPGHLEILGHQLDDEQAAALAPVVVVAGEALQGSLADHWARLLGPGGLVNEYGPTETSVGTCVHPLTAPVADGVVPIGSPLPGMVMRVLDTNLREVPLGATGELHVGGTGVARGYVGRPGATADRFVPDPGGPAGARLYRTGDLVRRLPGGAVDFLGRGDDQVKIRGHRIELGEIRAVLAGHPLLRDAVVVTHRTASGELALAGYTVAAGERAPTEEELQAYCARRLPDYMIPPVLLPVPAVPLNANGKLDRAALPAPVAAPAAGPDAPLSPAEQRISEIWQDILGREVTAHDHFFRSGGNSILAIRLIAELHDEFDIHLPVRTVFEQPTVAGQAQAVEDAIRAEIDELSDELSDEEQHA